MSYVAHRPASVQPMKRNPQGLADSKIVIAWEDTARWNDDRPMQSNDCPSPNSTERVVNTDRA